MVALLVALRPSYLRLGLAYVEMAEVGLRLEQEAVLMCVCVCVCVSISVKYLYLNHVLADPCGLTCAAYKMPLWLAYVEMVRQVEEG